MQQLKKSCRKCYWKTFLKTICDDCLSYFSKYRLSTSDNCETNGRYSILQHIVNAFSKPQSSTLIIYTIGNQKPLLIKLLLFCLSTATKLGGNLLKLWSKTIYNSVSQWRWFNIFLEIRKGKPAKETIRNQRHTLPHTNKLIIYLFLPHTNYMAIPKQDLIRENMSFYSMIQKQVGFKTV